MKKTVTTLLVVATVFLCSSFPVFAQTSGGKTIVTSVYSYNNGDVTTYARVNGHYDDKTDNGEYRSYSYQHTFSVILSNHTNEFQVADTDVFTIDLYTGFTDTFSSTTTNTSDGSSMPRPVWGSEVTSYSENMSAPRVLMYSSGDLAGHVLISFEDSESIVLNPNETREYNFTINFNMNLTVNSYPINGNALYSYFTYTGTVGFYSRPTSFSSNTIEDFINNDSLPNSLIAWLIAQYNQGEVTQELLNQLLDTYNYNLQYSGGSAQSNFQGQLNYFNSGSVSINAYYSAFRWGIPTSVDIEALGIADNSQYLIDKIYKIPVYFDVNARNLDANNTKYVSNQYLSIAYNLYNAITVPSDYKYLGYDFSILLSDGMYPYSIWGNQINLAFSNTEGSNTVFPIGQQYNFTFMVYVYYGTSEINAPSFSYSMTNPLSGSFSGNVINGSQKWYSSIAKNFADLRDLLTGNKTNNDAISDQVDDNQAQEDVIHAQEQQWYQDNETAINAVGLSNYQFSGDQTSGLSGVTSQFTSVWNALDGWTNVYIFVLTLSLATFILRHRPTTKQQQRRENNDIIERYGYSFKIINK